MIGKCHRARGYQMFTLTLDRSALEWLCNLVPGFCDLCVLMQETQWCFIRFDSDAVSLITGHSDKSFTWLPGLTRRRAASAQRWAALITSAFLPVSGLSWKHTGRKVKDHKSSNNKGRAAVSYHAGITHLGHSNNEAVSHIWDEAINMHTQITANRTEQKSMRLREYDPNIKYKP